MGTSPSGRRRPCGLPEPVALGLGAQVQGRVGARPHSEPAEHSRGHPRAGVGRTGQAWAPDGPRSQVTEQ
eukprot:13787984-Alexandrium_andersonii.AAC.1